MRKLSKMLAMLLTLCLVAAFVCLPVSAEDDSAMLAEAKQGVVQIRTAGYIGDPHSGGVAFAGGTGSGFAVGVTEENEAIFLTNWHVVTCSGDYDENHVRVWILRENANIQNRIEPDPADAIACEILYVTDGYPDLAVIKALEPIEELKTLPLMSSEDILDGARVYALGYPGVVDKHSGSNSGKDDITITTGIISKHMTMVSAEDTKVLLHDAHIQQGNSGGPLITSFGAVVGLNTYGFGQDTSTEYSCAVYIDYAMDAMEDLGLPFTVYSKEPEPTEPSTEETVAESVEETAGETETGEPGTEEGEDGEDEDKGILLLIAGIAAGAAVLVAVVILVLRRRRNREQKPEARVIPQEQPVAAVHETAACFLIRCPDGRVVQVSDRSVMIGRNPGCQICLPDGTKGVSREHCRLEVKRNTLILTDVGSSYGTFVNGKKIPANTPVAVNRGSRFWLATEKVTFYVQ